MAPNRKYFDQAVEELDQELADGEITQLEYRSRMRDLNDDYRAAYDDDVARAKAQVEASWGEWG